MSRADSHAVGGWGRAEISFGVRAGEGRSHLNGEGGLLGGLSFGSTMRTDVVQSKRPIQAPVVLMPPRDPSDGDIEVIILFVGASPLHTTFMDETLLGFRNTSTTSGTLWQPN